MSVIPQSVAYKESGIPWVGKIPEHWEVLQLKFLGKLRGGDGFPHEYQGKSNYDFPFYKVGDLQKSKDGFFMGITDNTISKEIGGIIKANPFPKNTLVWAKIGEALCLNRRRVLKRVSYIDNNMTGFILNQNADLRYAFYLVSSIDFALFMNPSVVPNISEGLQAMIRVPLPPLEEQKKIADFLDKKTRQIEEFITKKQKLITLLEEKKQTLINQCVTQGLDPSTPLKDSGVEWLGKIPTHWEVRKLKLLFGIGSGLGITKADFVPSGIPCVSYGEIHSKYPCRLNTGIHPLPYVSEDYLSSKPQALLKKGDFVFADTSEDIEGSGNFTSLQSDEPVFAGYHTIVLKPKTQSIHSPYFSFLFDSLGIRNQVRKEVCGVKVYSITKSILKEVQCLIPPLEEQKAIAEYLDTQIEKIDLAICKIKSQINLIKEYKTTLISEAVCGRIGI